MAASRSGERSAAAGPPGQRSRLGRSGPSRIERGSALTFACPPRVPAARSFDPLNFKGGASYSKLQVNEIKNGRLAMIAFSGIATQAALTGHGFPYL
jgi:hypothetical protein